MKTAIVIGATGMVGHQLMKLLIKDDRFSKVVVFTRRSVGINHSRIEQHIIDFDAPHSWRHLVRGHVLFSSLGTTLKQARSKEKQYQIDHTYQYEFAKAAAENKVSVYVLVSSASANAKAKTFYLRMKGELERDVKKLEFKSINIIQPGLLTGDREQPRVGERVGEKVLRFFNSIGLLKRYRPIKADIVAQAMLNAGIAEADAVNVFTLEDVLRLAEGN
jgi:uncharacterized protein YbjT (DUF2867 family)